MGRRGTGNGGRGHERCEDRRVCWWTAKAYVSELSFEGSVEQMITDTDDQSIIFVGANGMQASRRVSGSTEYRSIGVARDDISY